jgi:hypothetical protein
MTNREKHSDHAALVGRILYASMFLLFGYGKITAYASTVSYMGSLGLPAPSLFTLLAIIIEIGGGFADVGWLSDPARSTRAGDLRPGFGVYRALPTWRSESIPALHEKHGDRRRSVCRFRRWRIFARRETIAASAVARADEVIEWRRMSACGTWRTRSWCVPSTGGLEGTPEAF